MHLNSYIPSPILRPFIKAYLVIGATEHLVNRVLPETSLVMAFRYKGHTSYQADNTVKELPASVISGLRRSGRLISYTKDTANLLVLFKEAGAAAFIKEPLHELFEDSITLYDCDGYRQVALVEEQLATATNDTQRIAVIEQFLLSRLYNHTPDSLVAAALQNIHAAKGMVKIKTLANSLYISQDAFEKRFRRMAGVTPKQFSYIVRMQGVVKEIANDRVLSDTALNAGYFDQPHFNKDFKLFTGQSPTEFLKSPVYW